MSDEIIVHALWEFTSTVCGIQFAEMVPCRMTNVRDEVTCPDCITILEIWKKNKKISKE